MGVWIETRNNANFKKLNFVTPFVGVWIETIKHREKVALIQSHPSWVCGLKHLIGKFLCLIEGHTLRGCVD